MLNGGCRWLGRIMLTDPVGLRDRDLDVAVLAQQRQQIVRRIFPPVLLAGLQRGGLGAGVGDRGPLDPIEMDDLRTGGPFRRAALARLDTCRTADRRCVAPGTRSSATKRNGPLPTISVICLNGSVLASRSGIITGDGVVGLLSAWGSSGNGLFSRNWMVRSSGAESSSVAAISAPPNASRFAQRRMLATQSRAVTRSPSCQSNPGRSVSFHSLPSFSTTWPSSICGDGV